MSILSDKYKIPEPVIKNMIQDGVISCSWASYEEVLKLYRQGKTTLEISDLTHISQRHVQRIIKEYKTP